MRRNRGLEIALLAIAIVIVALVPTSWASTKFKTLNRFTGGKDGGRPISSMVFDHTGNLYGTTYSGGTKGKGTVFKLTRGLRGSWTESVLHRFCSRTNCSDGSNPASDLVADAVGNLYGTTFRGGANGDGTVFKLKADAGGSWTEKVLYSFTADEGSPYDAGLIIDQAGNLYGTTIGGGSGGGTVFELVHNSDGSWTESVLHTFQNQDGYAPTGNLTLDKAGSLYGATSSGGMCGAHYGSGVVFQLTPNADQNWTESVLYTFGCFSDDGAFPDAGVIFDQAGNLYGTTDVGGNDRGGGTVFELTPNRDGSWTESVLYVFCSLTNCDDGAEPVSLSIDQTGNLYGTTFHGGTYGYGVAFDLAGLPDKVTEHVLHTFAADEAYPSGKLIFDTRENLYGTTEGLGSHDKTGHGTVFEITPWQP